MNIIYSNNKILHKLCGTHLSLQMWNIIIMFIVQNSSQFHLRTGWTYDCFIQTDFRITDSPSANAMLISQNKMKYKKKILKS